MCLTRYTPPSDQSSSSVKNSVEIDDNDSDMEGSSSVKNSVEIDDNDVDVGLRRSKRIKERVRKRRLLYERRSLPRRIRSLTCWLIYLFRLRLFKDWSNGILSKKEEANGEKEEEQNSKRGCLTAETRTQYGG